MRLLEQGLRDGVLLLDLPNATPVIEWGQRDTLAERTPGWLHEHGVTEAELADLAEARKVFQAVARRNEAAAALGRIIGRGGQCLQRGRGNPDYRLFLIDRSKPNTARWCSMATCGNRMKARRHHQQRPDCED
ncbi:CGNR zinc finger domain-containing protein [Mycolicibacterium setense]